MAAGVHYSFYKYSTTQHSEHTYSVVMLFTGARCEEKGPASVEVLHMNPEPRVSRILHIELMCEQEPLLRRPGTEMAVNPTTGGEGLDISL